MKKKIARFSAVPLLAASIFYSFSTKEAVEEKSYSIAAYKVYDLEADFSVKKASEIVEKEDPEVNITPLLEKSYVAFKDAVGFRESGGDYQVVNDFGYLGKYQFGRGTLALIGIQDAGHFLNSPEMQEAAFYANASRNKWILRRDIVRFHNKIINGVKVTESGILAAAHLGGPGNVKKYLRSGGEEIFEDGFGTSIEYYLKKFAGYDTSFVKPDRFAKAVAVSESTPEEQI